MKKDTITMIFNYQYYIYNKIYAFLTTFLCHVKMSMQNIKYGKQCIFRGNAIILKYPNTSVVIGDNCVFNSSSRFNFRGINHRCILQTSKGGAIKIGSDCGFSGVSIVSSVSVHIGNNVICGTNVMIGDRNDHEDLYPQFKPSPIEIGDNVWVGMNVVIMKGVKIGENTIIGANSIVTKNIPANVIAAGNPCRVIRQLNT